MMWLKWFPWRYLIRKAALRHGFLDPIKILSQLQNFAQPSEVAAPTELLRSGVVLHARGLLNSLAIQHNLDWVWPFWVECQYDPLDVAFIPRSFSLTQINLTHRNWTALGLPDSKDFPLVDPRGLITPFYDGWSIDVWIIPETGESLIPSRCTTVFQQLLLCGNLVVNTESNQAGMNLKIVAKVIGTAKNSQCKIFISGYSGVNAQLVVSFRPYNPEGVSFINKINWDKDNLSWCVNGKERVYFDIPADRHAFSNYKEGDVYGLLILRESKSLEHLRDYDCAADVSCTVGMASAAAVFDISPLKRKEVVITIPLNDHPKQSVNEIEANIDAQSAWETSLNHVCKLCIPDKHFMFLYDAAIRTMILHSPKEVYPGPYIYRRFWFRDAAFILYALLCVGLKKRVKRSLDCFKSRQTRDGYFLSQEGEWDSNGEALWIMRKYCEMTGEAPSPDWQKSIKKAGLWIIKKRMPTTVPSPHAGLLPSGFSAEHFGPNDFYYWDDFWGVAGLQAAAWLNDAYQRSQRPCQLTEEAGLLLACIEDSLKKVQHRLNRPAMPASPYRRMDTGAIGSLVASYPLKLFKPNDSRIIDTTQFLMENCLVRGGFFHDMTHSGINPYLTLHLAQVLLRAGDSRYFELMKTVADLASPTGQWPESIHPRTGGGCMGDGQHVWAAAEWVMMIRNCFVREEDDRLILCSGIPQRWIDSQETMSFGPAPTSFGDICVTIRNHEEGIDIQWHGQWMDKEPGISVELPNYKKITAIPREESVLLRRGDVCPKN